jgi:hypothetical protein
LCYSVSHSNEVHTIYSSVRSFPVRSLKQKNFVPHEHGKCYIEPIHQKIYSLGKVNNILKQTRDRLLTRLISGKLSVEYLDIQFPPSMREKLE